MTVIFVMGLSLVVFMLPIRFTFISILTMKMNQ